jgi:UDP-N-acetylmuramoylalanine--D-glutamate ligase
VNFKNRQVGILGAGRSGLAAAKLLLRLGARVFLSDSSPVKKRLPYQIDAEFGKHSLKLLDSTLIIRSPGVSSHLPIMRKIQAARIPVWSELELAYTRMNAKRLIAITGTNGKTTTTTLVGEIYKAAAPTVVAGNIGLPLAEAVSRIGRHTTVVTEVSSYQLENIHTFHPRISAILNVTPDHLEHHGSMSAYADAKARLFENQTARDVCVMNADDPWCKRLAKRCKARMFWFSRKQKLPAGIFRSNEDCIVHWNGKRLRFPLKTHLPGPHNVENVLAAIAIGLAGGVSLKIIQRVLERFKGVEHRLEWVRTREGVSYVNDSKATNVDSARVALESFDRPLILILGGEGKGSPYAPLKTLIRKHVKTVLLIGEDSPKIARELRGAAIFERCQTMGRAVKRAAQIAKHGDVVLLSPACASFDQYNNYEERGRDFKSQVKRIS